MQLKNLRTPITKYTKAGNLNIAYQVFGSGPVDIVYVPGWISNIDLMWSCPELVAFFEELGKMGRVILFDKRGTGLSDRVVELSTLEERMEDINAVMHASGSKEAILFGHSEGGSVSALFSATYPDKVISLISFGIFAKRRYSKDYPWAPTDEERQQVYDMINNDWCSHKMQLESLAPSKANDPNFMSWLTSYFRSGASPSAALKLTKMNTDVNIVDVLKYISVPTLIMQRTNDIDVKIDEGKFISKHIKRSKFVEFDGEDHLFWVGNTQEVLNEIKDFIKTTPPKPKKNKGLMTVLFGQISNMSKSSFLCDKLKRFIDGYNTSVIHIDEECFAVTFKTSGRAIDCGLSVLDIVKNTETLVKMGMYMKEDIQGLDHVLDKNDKHLIKCMLGNIDKNQLLVTETIKNLQSGSRYEFNSQASVINIFSKKACKLFLVERTLKEVKETEKSNDYNYSYDTFLEDIIRIIEENIDNNEFSVDVLRTLIGVSERQLQRRIKELTGKSPNQLILNIRLNKAKEVLLSLDSSNISEIAFQFGFSSPSYFSKCFRKEFGITPRVLKEKLRDATNGLQIVAL